MNVEQMKKWIAAKAIKDVESAWVDAMDRQIEPENCRQVLFALNKAGYGDVAETLGTMMVEAQQSASAEQKLEMVCEILLALPQNNDLRQQCIALFKEVHSQAENFEDIWRSAGLDGNQSPRRAIRTMRICLDVKPGDYMGNRYDESRVIRIQRLTPMGDYEFTENGVADTLEPKLLADEFDVLPANDFRVLKQDPETLEVALQKKPGDVLIGLVLAKGGELSADNAKDILTPKYFKTSQWSKWWSRARTAAKKNPNITFEGRNPVMVVYSEKVQTVEDQLAEDVKKAYHPVERLSLLRTYYRECNLAGSEPQASFTTPILDALVEMANRWAGHRPVDALEAVGVLELGAQLGATTEKAYPSMSEILAHAADPASAVAELPDKELWPMALEALRERDDAADQFGHLFTKAPAEQLHTLAELLAEHGQAELPEYIVNQAMNDPLGHLDVCIWVWKAKELPIETRPDRVTVLSRLLQALHDVDHKWETDSDTKRDTRQKIRAALIVRSYGPFIETLDEIGEDEGMASVVKTKVERVDGLSDTVRDRMLSLIRDRYFSLFLKKKIDPWLDQNVIWTTEPALEKRNEELKQITEVDMPANAKQIGEAAAQGDLRENADWQAAIEERDMLVSRVRKINQEIAMSRIIETTDVPDEHVGVGSRVTLKRASDGQEVALDFLGPWDSDPENRVYAYTTRLAQNLMGKRLGMTLELQLDGEAAAEYAVEKLESAL